MILQSKLDLSTFEIIRFRIWNQTSNPDDYGIGTKYFNTNSGHDGYNRENIYTETGWRKTAYLDDIDKITNGEGSLGTRVKALEDMLGLQDVTDVIDTWNDVKEFFANVDEGLTLMTMLDGKLDTKGGTITGTLTSNGRIILKSFLQFKQFNADTEYLLGMTDNNGILRWYNGSSWNTLLHSGNFNDIARPLASGTWGIDISGKSAGIISVPSEQKGYGVFATIGQYATSSEPESGKIYVGSDSNYNVLSVPQLDGIASLANIMNLRIRFSPSFYSELAVLPNERKLWFRSVANNQASSWKTIAFTDSNITGNAATATALKNKVSLWGNEFDGTQSLSAGIKIENNSGLYFKDKGKTKDILVAFIDTNDRFFLGMGALANEIPTYLLGKNITFQVGKSYTTAMTITDEGNVLVGDSVIPNETNCLFHLKRRGHFGTAISSYTLGASPKYGLTVGNVNEYGLYLYTTANQQSNIQACSFDGTATAYALNLNPLGGAVNVGEGGLNVNGTIKSGDKFILTTTSMNLGSATTPLYLFLTRPDANFIWASANGGYINLGVYDSGPTSSTNATLSIYSDRVVSGQRNNAVSLGTSAYRWSDVYSVNGNFSNAVTVGSTIMGSRPTDGTYVRWKIVNSAGGLYIQAGTYDGNSANGILHLTGINNEVLANLNVRATLSSFSGLATFNGGALIPTGQKLTIGSVTFEEDAAGRVKVDGDMYTTGTLASGGKAKEGTGTGSGSANVRDFELPADGKTTYDCDHLLKSKNVIVQVFEKTLQNNIEVWEMILTDVTIVTEDRVTVTFGRPHNKVHRVHIIGGNVS